MHSLGAPLPAGFARRAERRERGPGLMSAAPPQSLRERYGSTVPPWGATQGVCRYRRAASGYHLSADGDGRVCFDRNLMRPSTSAQTCS